MIGYLGYRAARGQWRMYQKSRKVKGGPWTPAAVFFLPVPMTAIGAAAELVRNPAGSLGWIYLGITAALVLLFTLSLHPGPSRVTTHYARQDARSRPQRRDLSPAAMRALADHVEEGEQ